MTIPAQMSLHGFIATTPQLTFTHSGIARLHFRAGVEHWRKEPDGAFTKLDSTFHDLVLFRTAAGRAYGQLRVGDQFLASGYINRVRDRAQRCVGQPRGVRGPAHRP